MNMQYYTKFLLLIVAISGLIPTPATAATVSLNCPSPIVIGATSSCTTSCTTGSGSITIATTTSSICSVSGTTVTGLAAGACKVKASRTGCTTSAEKTITVNKKPQTITFATPAFSPTLAYVGDVATVNATATSGLPVTFSSGTTSICTVSGNTVTAIAAGTCTIRANQAGNTAWLAATQVSTNATISKKSQTITFAAPAFTLSNPPTFFVGDTATVSATASSGLGVTFTSNTSSICTISGTVVTAVTSGTCTINANQAGNGTWNAATQVQSSISISKRDQILSDAFSPTTVIIGGTTTLTVTSLNAVTLANTGLTVTLTNQTTSVCSMSTGNSPKVITGTIAGTCIIRATQAGNTAYNAATATDFSIIVAKKPQTISAITFPSSLYITASGTISATATSGLQVTFSSLTPSVCSVGTSSGTAPTTAVITGLAGGTCTIAANQAGNATWAAAPQITGSIEIINANFTVTATADPPSTDPTTVTVTQGFEATATITVTPIGSFTADVTLSISAGLPGNTNIFFNPTVITGGSGTATLRFAPTLASSANTYTVTIKAVGVGITNYTTIDLRIVDANGGWMDFYYMQTNTDDVYTNDCNGANYGSVSKCSLMSPADVDWRMRSSDVNVMYYNPNVTYMPWPDLPLNSIDFPDASFTAARSNPHPLREGYTALTNLTGISYEVADDNSGFSSTRPHRGTASNRTTGGNGLIDLWDNHIRYTVNAASVTQTTYDFGTDNERIVTSGDVGLNPLVTTTTLSDPDVCYEELGGSDLYCRTIAETQQNIANWYQYYRRRSLTTKAAVGNVIANTPQYRYGFGLINDAAKFKEMPTVTTTDVAAHNSALLNSLYSHKWTSFGTPLQAGLDRAGQYYKGTLPGHTTTLPIISQCQQNFTILMTDGYWNGTLPSGVGDVDGDTYSTTVADVARKYYLADLSTTYPNVVPTSLFDEADWQHMVSFMVALGVTGNLADMDGDGWPNPPLIESSNWGNPSSNDPTKIDDMWHGAYNSRGTFVSAQSPQELQQAMSNALANISVRIGTAASIATNSTRLDTNTLIYQAKFNPTGWSGRLVAYRVNPDGTVGDIAWDTQTVGLPAPSNRKIYTWNDFSGIPFNASNWDFLSASQQTALRNGGTVSSGLDRLNWLLGDQTREQPAGTLRKRTYLLGDIVNSNPAFAGGDTDYGYTSLPGGDDRNSYATFVDYNKTRRPMLYVGANDALLHAFDASTGEEKFGYIPNAVFPNLQTGNAPSLTGIGYNHRYFVDGSPQVAHAYWSGAWHTVLVGSNGAGAKSLFALDVTDPDTFNESKVLWEFTDTDLGYPIGQFTQPAIGRAKNGDWVVIFGNGYESTNNRAMLYIVRVNDGALVKKIDTGVGSATSPNGMSGPVLIADSQRLIKYAYAGDLRGNMWKFDLSGLSPNNWRSAFTASGAASDTPKPLFQAHYYKTSPATDVIQPIVAAPDVGLHPNSGYIVVFGTGKFFETTDHLDVSVQSVYGIWDKNDGTTACAALDDSCVYPTNRSTLQQQSITAEVTANSRNWRIVSSNPIDWDTQRGWYLDFLKPTTPPTAEGERVVSAPVLSHGRAIVITLIPAVLSCFGGGTSWIMEINMQTGGSLNEPVFDVNQDGLFDDNDKINNGEDNVSGSESNVGIINAPSIISAGSIEYKYGGGSTGDIMVAREKGSSLITGRTSWTQIQ